MFRRVVLGEVVREIGRAGGPGDVEHVLADTVGKPPKTHIHSFATFLFHGTVKNTVGGAVIRSERSARRGLGMTELNAGGFQGDQFTSALEKGCNFCFSSGADDHFEDGSEDQDWCIDNLGVAVAVAEEDISCGPTSGLGGYQECCVAITSENHIAGVVGNTGVRVSCTVVKEVIYGSCGFMSAGCDLG